MNYNKPSLFERFFDWLCVGIAVIGAVALFAVGTVGVFAFILWLGGVIQ